MEEEVKPTKSSDLLASTESEQNGTVPADSGGGITGKGPILPGNEAKPKLSGDDLPENLQKVLLNFYQNGINSAQQNQNMQNQNNRKKNSTNQKNSNPKSHSKKESNTTIRIRIPPHTPKKCKRKSSSSTEDFQDILDAPFSPSSRGERSPHFRASPHFNLRSTTPTSRFPQPKRVLTPDWETHQRLNVFNNIVKDDDSFKGLPFTQSGSFEDFPDEDSEENENEKIWTDLDQLERHRRLEIYECRIIWGLTPEYQHPAQAVKAAKNGMSYVLSKEEYEKSTRYEQIPCKHIVPKFWEPRIWDKAEDVLNDQQTEELEGNIISASTPKLAKPQIPHSHSSKKLLKRSLSVGVGLQKRGRPKRNIDFNTLILPIGNYETESENDVSDWLDEL